ncbi:MAG: ATP-binding protein [Thermodesulfobacteriota bacterium]|nr:ATP-binding protein [Thermodesulfobacteriota bacterium]
MTGTTVPFFGWHDHREDLMIVDAILNRLIHNAHRTQLKGGSMRKKQKLDANRDALGRTRLRC